MLGTIQGALFLFMFRYIFGGAINPGNGIEYVDFLVPGFLVTAILWLGNAVRGGGGRRRGNRGPRPHAVVADPALVGDRRALPRRYRF
jgi:hypothetical protein